MLDSARKLALSLFLLAPAATAADQPPVPPTPPTPPVVTPVTPVLPVAPVPPVSGPVAPPVGPKPIAPQITIQPQPRVNIDWNQCRNDFLSTDAAKQAAATKTMIDSGANGYNVLGSMLTGNDPAIVKRATQAREQIDNRAFQMFQDASELAAKVQKEPQTVAVLETVRQAWMHTAMYAAQPTVKQTSFQNAQELQKTIKSVSDATKQLSTLDDQLKAAPAPQGLARASVQVERAGVLMTLQRPADALTAAQDAVKASGKEGRFTPPALKAQADASLKLDDHKSAAALCRQILQEHPKSLEVKFAYSTLIQDALDEKRWDEAIDLVKTFTALCPIDEASQESIYTVLDALMNSERDYKHVLPYAEWVLATLPVDRLNGEVPKLIGGCSEYVFRNYAKSERAYTMLRDQFADSVNVANMDAALARIKLKADGKFPHEPAETDVGLAGVFAKFLKAARERDTKTLSILVPKADSEEFVENFGNDDTLPTLTFADYVVKKAEQDDVKGTGELTLDYYEAASSKPREMKLQAVKEDGQWKIAWEAPDAEDDAVQLTPAPGPAAPATPAIPPAEAPKK